MDEHLKALDTAVAKSFTTPEKVDDLVAVLASARRQGAKDALGKVTNFVEETYAQIDV